MTTIAPPHLSVGTLRRHLRGVPVIGPGEPGWDLARQAFNTTVDQRPALVATPLDEDDVAAVVRYAQAAGLRVAPQRTGHNAAPLGDLSDSILLKTAQLQGVFLGADLTARVRAGAKWENVVPRASKLGLAGLHGSTPDVSVVGYSLGGGLGWYGRKHGLAANSVSAVELVTADGELRRVDADTEPELFWALRGGGGGNFGVVTALEFDLYPISEVYAGVLFFPFERASEVLHAWHEWLPSLPDEMTSLGRLLQFPPIPAMPDHLRGQSFAVVEATFLGSEEDGRALMAPLRELGPAMDTFQMRAPVGLSELHMDPPSPVPYTSSSLLVDELPAQAIDDLVAVAGPGSGSPLVSVELRHLGGALARSGAHHGAIATLPGTYAMFAVGGTPDAAMYHAVQTHAGLVADTLRPYEAGHYSNFSEESGHAGRFFGGEAWDRLRAVKADVDPDNVFRANHAISPAD